MGRVRYTEEFKAEAVRQVIERKHSVPDVAQRLGITTKSLYLWVRTQQLPVQEISNTDSALQREVVHLRAENKRLQEERDILKKAAAYFAKESR